RALRQVRSSMSGRARSAFLDMPWIPVFLIGLFLFHPMIGFTAVLGTAAIIDMTLVSERISRCATKDACDRSDLARRDQGCVGIERAAAGAGRCDAAQRGNRARPRHDGSIDGA